MTFTTKLKCFSWFQKKLSISKGNKLIRSILYNGFINLNEIFTEKLQHVKLKPSKYMIPILCYCKYSKGNINTCPINFRITISS